MNAKGIRRYVALAAASLLGLAVAAGAAAQGMFYQEVAKDGRIYVFADGQRYESWSKSGEIGKAITRLGSGPDGETVVFDSEDAINLYNFKHGLPGEVFKKPSSRPSRPTRTARSSASPSATTTGSRTTTTPSSTVSKASGCGAPTSAGTRTSARPCPPACAWR